MKKSLLSRFLLAFGFQKKLPARNRRALIQLNAFVKGVQDFDRLANRLQPGTTVQLIPERNPDLSGELLRIEYKGRLIGRLPEADARQCRMLFNDIRQVPARIAHIDPNGLPWNRLRIRLLEP